MYKRQLIESVDNARGLITIQVFTEKGKGPSRNQTLMTTAVDTLETLNSSQKTTTGVYMRLGSIEGPDFSSTESNPLFKSEIDTSFVATVLS